jgi:ATP-dependent Clp protease ATP-binding subunit ClpC
MMPWYDYTADGDAGFSGSARKAFQLATREAYLLNHDHIGTEHLLLGLVAESTGVASRQLREYCFSLEGARQAVEKVAPAGDRVIRARIPYAADVEQVIARARAEASALDHKHVGTGHLLLVLLAATEGKGPQVLATAVALPGPLREHLLDVLRETDWARREGC